MNQMDNESLWVCFTNLSTEPIHKSHLFVNITDD